MKNLNSLDHVRKGIEYEEKRQRGILLKGGEIEQETRRFDEPTGTTVLMRSKEEANDYRYFPEPDLPTYHISNEWIEEVRESNTKKNVNVESSLKVAKLNKKLAVLMSQLEQPF